MKEELEMTNSDKKTLLIVEDDIDIRDLLQMVLENEGIEVLISEDGVDGLQKVQEYPVDAILCDITMPRMNGYEFLERLRQNNFETPLIFVTGISGAECKDDCLRRGAHGFLNKPYKTKELKEAIHEVLDIGFRMRKTS